MYNELSFEDYISIITSYLLLNKYFVGNILIRNVGIRIYSFCTIVGDMEIWVGWVWFDK